MMVRWPCALIAAALTAAASSTAWAGAGTFAEQAELPVSAVSAVAINGAVAIVGSSSASGVNGIVGAAYVFVRSGATWSLQQTLSASDGQSFDEFGSAVAVSGSTAIIGAMGKNSGAGGAYVFANVGGTWSQQQEILASDGNPGDSFGTSLALSGSTLLVGAYLSAQTGAAYVFSNSGGSWSQTQKLLATNGAPSDFFGFSVSLSGSTAVIGAFGANQQAGAAYVFASTSGTWSEQQKLVPTDAAASADFGFSVAVSGTTAVIGAQGTGTPGAAGSAYVFTGSAGTWSQQQELLASDANAGNEFGSSVAIAGSTIFVGAPQAQLTGAAYLFGSSGAAWSQLQEFVPSDANAIGLAAAFDGVTALLGANNAAYAFAVVPAILPVPALGSLAPVLAALLLAIGWFAARNRGVSLDESDETRRQFAFRRMTRARVRGPAHAVTARLRVCNAARVACAVLASGCVVAATAACRAGAGDEAKPVPECQQYEALFARCMRVNAAIASQPAALASTEADRTRLAELCTANMNRLRQTCR